MRLVTIIMVALFGLLQYELWFSQGGLVDVYRLKHDISRQKAVHQSLVQRNAQLAADIDNLKNGTDAIESHARYDLGMVKKGEVFYQVLTN